MEIIDNLKDKMNSNILERILEQNKLKKNNLSNNNLNNNKENGNANNVQYYVLEISLLFDNIAIDKAKNI